MSHVPTVLKSDRSVFDKMLPVDDNDVILNRRDTTNSKCDINHSEIYNILSQQILHVCHVMTQINRSTDDLSLLNFHLVHISSNS